MLAIDVGNTRIKLAEWRDGAWQSYSSHMYNAHALAKILDVTLKNFAPQPVYIACVVDDVTSQLSYWFEQQWKLKPIYCKSNREQAGVTNGYEKADTLGIDRWLSMIAAYNKFKSSVCVIGCGTAVTFDVVSDDGVHQGGLIMPGLRLMQQSLLTGTSKIGAVNGVVSVLGKSTGDAVESGCVQLMARGLDGLIQKQLNGNAGMRVVITGGDARHIIGQMQMQSQYVDTLVLDGVRIVATLDS